MITSEEIETLKETLGKLTHYKEDDLVSRLEWGAVTFEDSRGDINLVQSIAADLESMPLNFLTTPTSQAIRRAIGPAVSVFDKINDFTTTIGDVSVNRKNIANELRSVAEELYQRASPWIYLAYKRGDTAKNIQQVNDAIKEAETMLGNTKTSVENELNATKTSARNELNAIKTSARNELNAIKTIVQTAREAAANVGVTTFTKQFGSEAVSLGKRSKKWLGATGVFAALTILAGVLFYFWPKVGANADGWDTLRNIASKGTIIAVLFTGTVWCGHIYRALIHQAAVNRHRELSLKTFQAFVQATGNPHVKDAVLMAATKTIFANVPTGLVKSSGGNPEGGVQFIEGSKNATETVAELAAD